MQYNRVKIDNTVEIFFRTMNSSVDCTDGNELIPAISVRLISVQKVSGFLLTDTVYIIC